MSGSNWLHRSWGWLLLFALMPLVPGLGSSRRLSYHEAFVAQGAREMLESGSWVHPTIGGLPWLEKPPLPWWLVAAVGLWTGGVTETVARVPSVLAAIGVSMGIAVLAARHYGRRIGILTGAVQATTWWTVTRGRLAEADILLAFLVTWTLVAFDGVMGWGGNGGKSVHPVSETAQGRGVRWAFLGLLGLTGLVKGTGFGAALIAVVIVTALLWQRDRFGLARLSFPWGWLLPIGLTIAWPLCMCGMYGFRPIALWMMHVAERVAEQSGPGPFAGEKWSEYLGGLLGQAMPWTLIAFLGAYNSICRAIGLNSSGWTGATRVKTTRAVMAGDRLLCCWAIAPLGLLSLATVKNAHYAISAQVPWSVWAALGLADVGEWLRCRGYDGTRLRVATQAGFVTVALGYGVGYWLLAPSFDRHGAEWAFYESVGCGFSASEPLVLLYDEWDRDPYRSPFGPIPHDLAVRLFYLGRSACWHGDMRSMLACTHAIGENGPRPACLRVGQVPGNRLKSGLGVVARERDRAVLEQLGEIEVVARGPNSRWDRSYALFKVSGVTKCARPMPNLQARAN
jgi:4-amino-4-deoxy-L-arabinose transferase-like glycosyltransferase